MGFVIGSVEDKELNHTLLEMYRRSNDLNAYAAVYVTYLQQDLSLLQNVYNQLSNQNTSLDTYRRYLEGVDQTSPYADWQRIGNLYSSMWKSFDSWRGKYYEWEEDASGEDGSWVIKDSYWKELAWAIYETEDYKDYAYCRAVVRSWIGTGTFVNNTKSVTDLWLRDDLISIGDHIYVELGEYSYASGDAYLPEKWLGTRSDPVYLVLDLKKTGNGAWSTQGTLQVLLMNGWCNEPRIRLMYKTYNEDGTVSYSQVGDSSNYMRDIYSFPAYFGTAGRGTNTFYTWNDTNLWINSRLAFGVARWRNGYNNTSEAVHTHDLPWYKWDDVVATSEFSAYTQAWTDYLGTITNMAELIQEFKEACDAYKRKWYSWIGTNTARYKWKIDQWADNIPDISEYVVSTPPYWSLVHITHPGPFTNFGDDYTY